MNDDELQELVDAVVARRSLNGLKPHQLVDSIHRKRLPADRLSTIEPLLHIESGVTYKYAIDVVGKMKGASVEASDAVEAAWERSWKHDVPQANAEAFRALLRIGDNEDRLLRMIERAMAVDNYGIHKDCVETLLKMERGGPVLANWSDTLAGRCDCHLHRQLAEKIRRRLEDSTAP
ncbi:hypothetical protein [Alienimonas chondri]|uniref:Uncharacterized protein n=1 Tax=Alienimonas chondri TaxID=2681879 RepID=A0ABX1VIJ9_9PLAN|nr:hypothetical protein [Alienimonas chondri]NNJ27634.1 hypothetical protein [Alienimonas chondri]